jgi:hypothetical protein
MTDDVPRDRQITEQAARTGEFPNATGDPMADRSDDSNPIAGGGAAGTGVPVEGEDAARTSNERPDPASGA